MPCRGRASTPFWSERARTRGRRTPTSAGDGGWDGRVSSVQSAHHFANPTTRRVTTRDDTSGTRWRTHRSRTATTTTTTTSFRSICDGHLHVVLGHLPRQERGSGSLIMELIYPHPHPHPHPHLDLSMCWLSKATAKKEEGGSGGLHRPPPTHCANE
ncbi:hypothetical protein GW17_00060732 [Ensete ventricosum]|nr:hypothetical protein GW17_00060732 [Ensete ventricosum]